VQKEKQKLGVVPKLRTDAHRSVRHEKGCSKLEAKLDVTGHVATCRHTRSRSRNLILKFKQCVIKINLSLILSKPYGFVSCGDGTFIEYILGEPRTATR
jgi:hypothetical protein